MNRRDFLALSAAAAGGALLGGCDAPLVGGGPDRSGLRKLVGLSLYADTPWTRVIASGVAAGLEGSGYALLTREARFSAAEELANLQSFAGRKVRGAIVLPVSVETATRGAQAVQQGGGAVVNALSPGEGGAGDKYYAALMQPAGEEGGRLIGRWLRGNVRGAGQVVIVQGLLGQGVSEQLDRGVQAALAGSDLEIVARGPGNLSARDAVAVVESALARYPDVAAIADYGPEMGLGIARFLQAEGRRDVKHASLGAVRGTSAALGTPYLASTLYFSASELGRSAARTLLSVLRDDAAQHDPFTVSVPRRMTDDVDRPPNQFGGPVAIDPPVGDDTAAPLPPTETEAGDLSD